MPEAAAPSDRNLRVASDDIRPAAIVDDGAVRSALAAHLGEKFEDEIEIDRFSRKSSGFSWITYSFVARSSSGSARKLILRVGPPNGLFAPYSVLPQVYSLQSLASSRVPVPAMVSFDNEGGKIGFPFFVCEYVDGEALAPWSASDRDETHRRDIAAQFIAILAELHKLDWRKAPLAELHHGSGEHGEVSAIATWRTSLERPTARYYPLLDWGGKWLLDHCPLPPRRTIVHGDYRLGNFLERDTTIVAILDWELTHFGDPHEDLAWALMPTFNGGSRKLYGVIEREEVIDRYQRASGISISARTLAFYDAFALYQAAAIQMCAIRAFEVHRFNDMRMAVMASQMASIVRAFDRALEAAA